MEEEGGVFAEAGEVAGGVVAGEGGYEVGGSLPYLECLVHGSGLTVIVIVVKRFWWDVRGGINRCGKIISSEIPEPMCWRAPQPFTQAIEQRCHSIAH
ncbi:hypothetical protein GCM10011247_44180 [Pseudomonas plecoglossicida]|nr:hypothetical protein GCM10011247_44180 [Pseudomonas plecoglossicida]